LRNELMARDVGF